eukprot:12172618-Alexandrium_andersonii.AAC.1
MGEPPGSGRAWLELQAGQQLLAEAAARVGGSAPSAARGSVGHFDSDIVPPFSPSATSGVLGCEVPAAVPKLPPAPPQPLA